MKKFLSILLSATMLITIFPASVGFAFSGETTKFVVEFEDENGGDVMPGDVIWYSWVYDSGFPYVTGAVFKLEYDPECLTLLEKEIGSDICSVTGENSNGVYSGIAMTLGTAEEFSSKKKTLVYFGFEVKEDVPVNTEVDLAFTCSEYKVYNDGTLSEFEGETQGPKLTPDEFEQSEALLINPQKEPSHDATLAWAKLGEEEITFDEDGNYAIELSYGLEIPAVTYEKNDENATAVDETVDGVTTITVTAQDGETVKVYTVTVTIVESATTGIKVDKESIEVPFAKSEKIAEYIKENITVNYVTQAGVGDAVAAEAIEVEAAEGIATVTVGDYAPVEIEYTIGEKVLVDLEIEVSDMVVGGVVTYEWNYEVTEDDAKAAITKVYAKYEYDNSEGYILEDVTDKATFGVDEQPEPIGTILTVDLADINTYIRYRFKSAPAAITTNVDAIEIPYGTEDVLAYVTENVVVTVTREDGSAYDYAADEIVISVDDKNTEATVSFVGKDIESATIAITLAKKLYTLTVAAVNGGTVEATYDDKTEDWYAGMSVQVTTGTEITLKAVAGEDSEFVYWMDKATDRIVYYGAEYPVVIGTDKKLVAVFATVAEDVFTVEFVDFNNKVYVYAASNTDITVPANPYVLGYTFGGWAINGVKTDYVAGQEIPAGTFTADTRLNAIQTLDDTKYLVTLIGANEEGGEYVYNKAITVTANVPEGKVFAYWTRDGKIVSYSENYMFYVANYNTTVEAVFSEEEVEAKATITMAEPTVVAGNKISFIMERTVPEGYYVVEAGILLKEGVVSEITLDNYDKKGTSTNKAPYGAYTVRKADVEKGGSWSAVGYLIYTDGAEVYTVYTAPVTGTVN